MQACRVKAPGAWGSIAIAIAIGRRESKGVTFHQKRNVQSSCASKGRLERFSTLAVMAVDGLALRRLDAKQLSNT